MKITKVEVNGNTAKVTMLEEGQTYSAECNGDDVNDAVRVAISRAVALREQELQRSVTVKTVVEIA